MRNALAKMRNAFAKMRNAIAKMRNAWPLVEAVICECNREKRAKKNYLCLRAE